MAAPFALTGRMEEVDLRDVPLDLRVDVAHKLAHQLGLTGYDYLEMQLAAQRPKPTTLEVDAAKAEIVLRRGKLPPGSTPKFA